MTTSRIKCTFIVVLAMILGITQVQAFNFNNLEQKLKQENNEQLKVQQTSGDDFSDPGATGEPETYDQQFALYDAFISGGKIWTFIPNIEDCSSNGLAFLNEQNETRLMFQNETEIDAVALLTNTSQIISGSFAEAYLYCHLSVVDGYIFYLAEAEKYESDLDWYQAFLQNMIGNVLTLNNYYSRITIADDNDDQLLMYYIFGKIFYTLAKFDPIDLEDLEQGSLSVDTGVAGASLASIMYLTQQLIYTQMQINAGTYNMNQASFDAIQQYERENHVIVQQFSDESAEDEDANEEEVVLEDDEENTDSLGEEEVPEEEPQGQIQQTIDQLRTYAKYGAIFVFNVNAASVGQVSGNISLCQSNATQFYNGSMGVVGEYKDEYYAEAGRSTYDILKSIDPILTSCYFSVFEYYIAAEEYRNTGSDVNKLSYNFAHNLGSIYDLSEEGIKRSLDIENQWDEEEYWARMGLIIGSNFQSLFEDPENYYPFDPEDPYEYANFADERE